MDVLTMRAMQSHKWAQIAAIKREARKHRPVKPRKARKARPRPRYYMLGG